MPSLWIIGACLITFVPVSTVQAQQSPPSQDPDTSAALATIKQIQAEAQNTSDVTSEALHSLPEGGSETESATAAIKALQEAAERLAASTPSPDIIKKSQYLQHTKELDAESKTDGELAKEWFLENPSGPGQPDTANLGEVASGVEKALDYAETVQAFLEASTPSYTAGPTMDQGPAFSQQETQEISDEMAKYQEAQQQYGQALQKLNDTMMSSGALPDYSTWKQSQGPQIKNGNQNTIPDCVLHHYACNK